MTQFSILAASLLMAATTAQAGGYLTNTNQSVNFLRNPARDGAIGIDGAYSNPAGVGFMSVGWHLGFDIQSAYQSRTTTSYFGPQNAGPFALGTVNGVRNNPDGVKRFNGKASAPVMPSLNLARVGEKWFATFHLGVTGGGGKCNFSDGLPSFESQVAMVPVLVGALRPGAVSGYSFDTHMQGRQYYFGGQFGVGYRINPNLNVNVGGRVIYANCNYYGYVRNINVEVQGPAGAVNMPAAKFFQSQGLPDFASLVGDRELNCDQSGWGFTPIVSVDYKTGRWNLSARYEFKTRLRLKNRSGVNTSGLDEFDDGLHVAADIPAILALGAQYEIIDGLRANGGFHYYFDRQATQHNSRHEQLKNGGWEVLAGMEYDLSTRWTVSAGWQSTKYGLGKDSRFITDMSFVTNSNSVGLGAAFRLKERVKLNVAYFKTFYQHYRKDMADYCDMKQKFNGMLQPMADQLQAGINHYQAILTNPGSTEGERAFATEKLQTYQHEAGALTQIATGLRNYSTTGYDNFHRTNDVFGVGLEIDF